MVKSNWYHRMYILKEPQNIIQKDTSIPVFIVALFTMAKAWEQRKCPLTDEWIKKI